MVIHLLGHQAPHQPHSGQLVQPGFLHFSRSDPRVSELHLKSLPGGMGLKIWWTLRQKRGEEGTLLPFHCGISGCPAEKGLSMGTL